MKEHIKHETGNSEAWICLCGNTPSDGGFYPINEENVEVEPTADEWKTNEYFCDLCGRVIDQDTLEVTRQYAPSAIARLA